ncbi:acyl-CoA thioesterase [Planctomycetota bacterium]|nr:acyl-CoA thioesterase [Planctomycetota bacterium]
MNMNHECENKSEPVSIDLYTETGDKILFDVKKPFIYHVNLDKSDIDGQGHVNNVTYVKWMEQAAVAHSDAVGYGTTFYQETGAAFFVRKHEVEYLAQSFWCDQLVVATWPDKMERFTAIRRYQVVRVTDGKTVARAVTNWIFMNRENERPQRMSKEMIDKFLQSVS